MIKHLLLTNASKRTPFVSNPSSITSLVSPNNLISILPNYEYSPSYFTRGNWRTLPHINQKTLPVDPTDIKGVDNVAYLMVNRAISNKSAPRVVQNRFFSLKFLPTTHYLSQARKSNVAYTFSNFRMSILNSPELGTCFSKYRGAFKNLDYFKTQPYPMGTAVARTKYRKFVKKELHKHLWGIVPNIESEIVKVSGIFCFRFSAVPTTREELQLVSNDIRKAVNKVYCDNIYFLSLQNFVSRQDNRSGLRSLMQNVQKENCIDANKVPGFYPKLPFLMSQKN